MARRWSNAIKGQAMADLAAGMTVKQVAEKYGMPLSTAGDLAPSSKRGQAKIRRFADLQEIDATFRDHAALNFDAQKAILEVFTDAAWLRAQSAADLVAAYTAFFAKSGKLLGALYGPAARQLDDDAPDTQDAP